MLSNSAAKMLPFAMNIRPCSVCDAGLRRVREGVSLVVGLLQPSFLWVLVDSHTVYSRFQGFGRVKVECRPTLPSGRSW